MSLISKYYSKFRKYFSNNHSKIYNYSDKHKALIKFIISGSLATTTNLVFLFIFHGLLNLTLLLSTSFSFIIAFFVSFSLQKLWTFRNHDRHKILKQLSLYLANAFLGLIINGILMSFFVGKCGLWYILAQIIVNIIIAVWNFFIFKFIIFKNTKNENFF